MSHPWYQLDSSGEICRFCLYVPAILRKNERYRAFGKGRFARIILSAPARKFEVQVAGLVRAVNAPPINFGTWKMTVHTIWDKQRHVVPSVPGGDSDASLSAIKDALQGAGVIDDDVRIISDETHNHYEKGERGLYVVLERVNPSLGGDLPLEVRNARVAGVALAAQVITAKPRKPRTIPVPKVTAPKLAKAKKPKVSANPHTLKK